MTDAHTSRRILVVMGGDGNERNISLATGTAMADALRSVGEDVVAVDYRRDRLAELVAIEADVALLAVHGLDGEDGHLQGLFEMRGIPYTGSGVLASALALDKVRSKQAFDAMGVPTPAWAVLPRSEEPPAMPIPAPCVVKASREGSSVGVAIVATEAEWSDGWRAAMEGEGEMLVEAFVDARELSVGVADGVCIGVVEIAPAEGFYDYEAKYERGDTNYVLPAPLSETVGSLVQRTAIAAYKALGCRGVSRVDIMLDAQGRPWVLEANTVPGMTATSLVPKMAEANGVDFAAFVLGLVNAATTDRAVNASEAP